MQKAPSLRRILVVLALAASTVVALPRPSSSAVAAPTTEDCRTEQGDRPEPGVQGEVPAADQLSGASRQGYWCNIRWVSSNDLEGRGADIQLTWHRDCAYQAAPAGDADSDGVAVLQVDRAGRSRLVEVIRRPSWAGRGGVLGIHEGLHVSQQRGLLVVPIGTMISVFDVARDCAQPRHLADFDLGAIEDPFHDDRFGAGGIHSGKLSPDGTLYYATDIGNGAVAPSGPCLSVVDLRDATRPFLLTRWGMDFPCHDLDLSPNGRRAYVGFYGPGVGHPSAVVAAFTPAGVPSNAITGLRIVDVTEAHQHRREPELRIVGELTGGRNHTEVFARIGGKPYVIGGEEAYCPGGNPRIVDVSDERAPKQVATVDLEINTAPQCARQLNRNGDVLLHMGHYFSVDDPRDAKLLFVSWYASGLRVFDISDPTSPREVAYYNPPVGAGAQRTHDWTSTYPRYLPSSGQIWFGSRVTGFNVVELHPALRPSSADPAARRNWTVPPRRRVIAASATARSLGAEPPPPQYCTLR